MKWETLLCVMLLAPSVRAADAPPASRPPSDVIRVATALEHLTVIECGEPVTMVAAGSAGFQIARRDDKVLIKPLESGVSTDLFVWTATRRFIYELQPPGEAREMNFVVDNRVPPTPQPSASQPDEEAIDSMARAFLAAQPIDTRAVVERKRGVNVRIQHVLVSKSHVYLHYSVSNMGKSSYRPGTPRVERLLDRPASVQGRRVQLGDSKIDKLGKTRELALAVANVHTASGDLGRGESAECVIVLDGPLAPGAVLELNFAPDGSRPVRAAVVL
jgi:hypothetical protein